jgi:methylated-DNA-[protein]-cysteine S-methyltransferase
MIYTHHYDSPLGGITLSAQESALTGCWFDGQKYFGAALKEPYANGPLPVFDEADRWLDIYFSGHEPDFLPPLSLQSTPFRMAVWDILLTIPYGKTSTYGALAARLVSSPRAVGTAVGRNPISVIIPCHRVIAADGSLAGYAGGIENKEKLLKLEGALR